MVEQNWWDENPIEPNVDGDFGTLLNGLDFSMESLEKRLGEDWDDSLYKLLDSFPDDCLEAVPNSNNPNEYPEAQRNVLFQKQSPISVLGNGSSCSDGNNASFKVGAKGRRSRRGRSSTLNPWLLMSPVSCTSFDAPKKRKEKKRKKLSGGMESNSFKKCTHCEITKTPQWREGPLGPKTLCNACGVRYRSGRLLPEYRPAASPTFIPSLHSNSHRKVIEMRRKAVEEFQGGDQEFVPMNSYWFDIY